MEEVNIPFLRTTKPDHMPVRGSKTVGEAAIMPVASETENETEKEEPSMSMKTLLSDDRGDHGKQ